MFFATVGVNICLCLAKLSILLLFLDIFPPGLWPRKAAYVLLVLVALYGVALPISNVLYCLPPERNYTIGGQCISGPAKRYAVAAIDAALDLAIFCTPLPVVWRMTLPRRQKVWVCFIFGLGILYVLPSSPGRFSLLEKRGTETASSVCFASIFRFYWLHQIVLSRDVAYTSLYIAYWATAEINVSIIIASIPTLHPLVVRFCPRLLAPDPISNDVNDSTATATTNKSSF
jgi:hypothetical protein